MPALTESMRQWLKEGTDALNSGVSEKVVLDGFMAKVGGDVLKAISLASLVGIAMNVINAYFGAPSPILSHVVYLTIPSRRHIPTKEESLGVPNAQVFV